MECESADAADLHLGAGWQVEEATLLGILQDPVEDSAVGGPVPQVDLVGRKVLSGDRRTLALDLCRLLLLLSRGRLFDALSTTPRSLLRPPTPGRLVRSVLDPPPTSQGSTDHGEVVRLFSDLF